nr:hypothetical protein [Tanacetum cinerariifolium]
MPSKKNPTLQNLARDILPPPSHARPRAWSFAPTNDILQMIWLHGLKGHSTFNSLGPSVQRLSSTIWISPLLLLAFIECDIVNFTQHHIDSSTSRETTPATFAQPTLLRTFWENNLNDSASVRLGTNTLGNDNGTTDEMALFARLTMYKVCDENIAAMDAAVGDEVDVLSLSLGQFNASLSIEALWILKGGAVLKISDGEGSRGGRGTTHSEAEIVK